jgi:hypothetical protein
MELLGTLRNLPGGTEWKSFYEAVCKDYGIPLIRSFYGGPRGAGSLYVE